MRWWILTASMATLTGCDTLPLAENPVQIGGNPAAVVLANPAYVAMGPTDYACLYEAVLDVLDDYFEIAYANRYDGTIRTFPRVAPGLEQPWRPGSPDGPERTYATLQSLRYRCDAVIQPGEQGGYMVYITVYRELEDVPRPIRATAGAAAFRSDNTVDRQFEVIDPAVVQVGWIPKGRETYVEQAILRKLDRKLAQRKAECP